MTPATTDAQHLWTTHRHLAVHDSGCWCLRECPCGEGCPWTLTDCCHRLRPECSVVGSPDTVTVCRQGTGCDDLD